MALKEYKPGTTFPGRHGPHHRRIGAGMAVAAPRQGRRAERPLHRHRRHRLRPARLLRLADRDAEHRQARQERAALQQHAHDGALLADRALHPDRPQPSLERDVLHHRGLDRLSRAATARSRSRTAFSPRCCCSRATATYAIGKWHLTPAEQISAAGPYDRWPLGRGFERYLRLPRRRHAPVLSRSRLRQSSGRATEDARGGLPPDRRSGRQGDRLHRRRRSRSRPTSRSFSTSRRARCMRRTTCRKEWTDKYKGKFDEGWDVYREKTFARQNELGIMPQGHEALAPRPRRAGMGQAAGGRAQTVCAHDGGVRRASASTPITTSAG